MTASVDPRNELLPEASIPTASLESILCTEELRSRPSRSPDYEKENAALKALAGALADPKANVLQTLAETILDVTRCDSSGLSLLTKDGKRFYWPAVAGVWKPLTGGGTPREFGPCGDVLNRNRALLFRHFERRYPYFLAVKPAAEECLLVPFYVGGKAVGTFWAITHSDRRRFDGEDERLMNALGHFASLAYQTVESIDDLKLQIAAREKAEAAARELASKRAEAEARESERRYREMQLELAHANRVATMGQITASIAHELKQPITATVANAQAALHWLGDRPPDLEEAREALADIVEAGKRAGEVIDRIRDLVKKAPLRKDGVDINEAVREVIALSHGEAVKNGVSVQTQLAEGLPLIQGDRVQLQQVILNLILNAVEAMGSVSEGARELLIGTGKDGSGGVRIVVQDSGPGLNPESLDSVFDAFYTTKPGGMGMGLSICRSIVESHGGQIWASRTADRGATLQFTLPAGLECTREAALVVDPGDR